MALFDSGTPSTLADVLGQQADTASLGIKNDYAKKRKQAAAIAGANGRLTSGVQNYTTGDINAGELSDLGGVQANLSGALGQIPTEDYLGTQEFDRQKQLAELIANLNKESTLSQVLGGIGTAAKIGGTVAAFCGGYVANECKVVDTKTGAIGIMAEKGPEILIRISTLGLTPDDIYKAGIKGDFNSFDEAGMNDEDIRNLIKQGLSKFQ